MTLSKNGAAVVVFILSILGVSVTDAQAVEFISSIAQVVSFIMLIWNQAKRSDVQWFVFKK